MLGGLRLNDRMPEHAPETPTPATVARVTDLLRRHPLIDGHNDLPLEVRLQSGYDFDRMDLSQRLTTTRTDLPRLRADATGAQPWQVGPCGGQALREVHPVEVVARLQAHLQRQIVVSVDQRVPAQQVCDAGDSGWGGGLWGVFGHAVIQPQPT